MATKKIRRQFKPGDKIKVTIKKDELVI